MSTPQQPPQGLPRQRPGGSPAPGLRVAPGGMPPNDGATSAAGRSSIVMPARPQPASPAVGPMPGAFEPPRGRSDIPDEAFSEDTVMRAAPAPPAPVAIPAQPHEPRRWPLMVGAGAAASLLGGTLGFFVFTHLGQPDVLDAESVATHALRIVHEDFGLTDAADMSCPANQQATTGHTFVCTFMQGSHTSSVQVVVTGDDGTYLVGGEPAEEKAP